MSNNPDPELTDQYLSNLENELLDFTEGYHTKYGEFPARSVFEVVLDRAGWEFSTQNLDDALSNPLLLRSFYERGIIPPSYLRDSTTGLTKEQLAVIAALNNTRDARSDVKKIRDLGITPRMFAGWMHSKRFTTHLSDSAENLLDNSQSDATVALLRKVRSGDAKAIRLYYEMTGRYNPATENTVNLQQFMTAVIEAIQKHVHSPQILSALAAELQMVSVQFNVNPHQSAPGAAKVSNMKPKPRELMF